MSIFEEKKEISRRDLREILRKNPKIPGSSKIFKKEERAGIEKEVFGKRHGQIITEQEFKKTLRELRRTKYKETKSSGKLDLDRKIRYLEKLSGLKGKY